MVSSVAPLLGGGQRVIIDSLVDALIDHGHTVDRLEIPAGLADLDVVRENLAFRLLDLEGWGDRLIAIRTPAHFVRHPAKNVWFIHHPRRFYDLWDTPHGPDLKTANLVATRELVHAMDTYELIAARNVFCNSRTVADRLRLYNGVTAEVIYPPLPLRLPDGANPTSDVQDADRNEIVYVSRVTPIKRQHLAVAAMEFVKTPVRLVLAGEADEPRFENQLLSAIERNPNRSRIRYNSSRISEAEKWRLLRSSLATVYLPEDEDSYGYPTLESARVNRPIVSVTDSGGVLEFIRDSVEGLIVAPEPQALAEAFDRLYLHRTWASELGVNAAARVVELGISWDAAVEALVR